VISNYCIEITPVQNNSGFTEIPDIGMFGGVIRWVSEYDATYTVLNSSIKFLDQKWIGTIANSVNAAYSGGYASNGGGSIGVISTTRLFKKLTDYDISIYNGLFKILESTDGGATYHTYKTGQVSQTTDNIKRGEIKFNDESGSTDSTITKEIDTSGKFYPVNFGSLPNAKTVSVKEDNFVRPWIRTDNGVELKAVWDVSQIFSDECVLFVPYTSGVDDPYVINFIASINESISQGGVALKQGDNFYPVSEVVERANSGGITGIRTFFTDPNTKDESGIIESGADVDLYASFVPWGITAYNDFFEGETVSEAVSNYDEVSAAFVPLPLIRTNEEGEYPVVNITDADSAGYDLFPYIRIDSIGTRYWTDVEGFQHQENMDVDGTMGNISDGLSSTFISIERPAAHAFAYDGYQIKASFDISPQSKISERHLFTAAIRGQVDGSGVGETVTCKIWFSAVDKFGKSYSFGSEGSPFRSFRVADQTSSEEVYVENCNPLLYDGTTFDEWRWESSGLLTDAGVEMSIDLSPIPDMVWETGFEFTVYVKVKSNVNRTLNFWRLKINQFQIYAQYPFKTDQIFTDVTGRKDQDDTLIESLPDVYEHALKMQNYSNREIDTPDGGWGLDYPNITDWSAVFSEADLLLFPSDITAFQIMSAGDATTGKIKTEICRLLWAIGYTDKSGVERLTPMIDTLYNTDGALITYGDLFEGELPTVKDRNSKQIYTDMVFEWGYNTATGDALNREIVSVNDESGDYYEYARVLYNVYRTTNKASTKGKGLWILKELRQRERGIQQPLRRLMSSQLQTDLT